MFSAPLIPRCQRMFMDSQNTGLGRSEPRSQGQILPSDWNQYKPIIEDLYPTMTLNDLVEELRAQGLPTNKRQLVYRLGLWGLGKYRPQQRAQQRTVKRSAIKQERASSDPWKPWPRDTANCPMRALFPCAESPHYTPKPQNHQHCPLKKEDEPELAQLPDTNERRCGEKSVKDEDVASKEENPSPDCLTSTLSTGSYSESPLLQPWDGMKASCSGFERLEIGSPIASGDSFASPPPTATNSPILKSEVLAGVEHCHTNHDPPAEKTLRLPCPFRMRNPGRFSVSSYPECAIHAFPDMTSLRQHVSRTHLREPFFRCPRCKVGFLDTDALVKHLVISPEKMCQVVGKMYFPGPEDGITTSTSAKLLLMDDLTWEGLWRVLFPDDAKIPPPVFGKYEARNIVLRFLHEAVSALPPESEGVINRQYIVSILEHVFGVFDYNPEIKKREKTAQTPAQATSKSERYDWGCPGDEADENDTYNYDYQNIFEKDSEAIHDMESQEMRDMDGQALRDMDAGVFPETDSQILNEMELQVVDEMFVAGEYCVSKPATW